MDDLGYSRYCVTMAAGGQASAMLVAMRHRDALVGLQLTLVLAGLDPDVAPEQEEAAVTGSRRRAREDIGYAALQSLTSADRRLRVDGLTC
jgi:hypothetical protein